MGVGVAGGVAFNRSVLRRPGDGVKAPARRTRGVPFRAGVPTRTVLGVVVTGVRRPLSPSSAPVVAAVVARGVMVRLFPSAPRALPLLVAV